MLEIRFNQNALEVLFNQEVKLAFNVGQKFVEVGDGEADFTMSRGSFKIKDKVFFKEALIIERFEATKSGALIHLSKGAFELKINNDILEFIPQGLEKYNKMWFYLPSEANEALYGSGEIFTEFNLKGLKDTVWVAEHINLAQTTKKLLKNMLGLKNSKHVLKFSNYETYYDQPTFVSSKKYFYHSNITSKAVFDFRKKDSITIETDQVASFYLSYASDFESLMTNLTSIVGRQPELPDWCYDGQILGIQGGTQVMLEKYNKVIEHNGKVNGIWIQDWEGRRVTAVGKQLFWNWKWDEELYPNLDKEIKNLNAKGVKVLGYCNPFLAIEKPLYKEATEKGYCVKNRDGEDYLVKITTFPAAMIDLTNPDAYNWLKEIIKKNMIAFGLSGWMADFGEYLPTDCVLFSGEDPKIVHNTWPARWAKLNREALEETGNVGKIMFFTRAGYTDTPRYSTMMWNGDNHPDFSKDFGLPSIIPAMLSLTMCGCGLSHSDIGGYTSVLNMKRNRDVYKRWFEMNAFTVLMRGHEGLNPDINIQFDADEDMLDFAARMSRIHVALKPYLKEAVEKNALSGVGVIRPLFFYYNESKAFNNGYEYLLGRDILVAPVLRPNAKKQKVYLPQDEWIHLWSGKEYKGGEYIIDAPYGEPPVFVRKEANKLVNKILEEI